MAHYFRWISLAALVTVPIATAEPDNRGRGKGRGQGQGQGQAADDAGGPDLPALKRHHGMRVSLDEKLVAVAKSEPTFEAARADLAAISKITDPAKRLVAMKAFGTKYKALRDTLLKKAGQDLPAMKRQLGRVPLQASSLTATRIVKPQPTDETITMSEYPEQYTFKRNCPDGGDEWRFSGEKSTIELSSAAADNDCDDLRAGKGIRIDVAAGVKQVEITVEYVYDMDIAISTLGWTGIVTLATGVRFESLSGAPIGTVQLPSGPQRVPVRFERYTAISAACDLLPYCGTSSAGTAKKTFFIDVDRAGPLLVTPYVAGTVDADMLASAWGMARIKDIRPFKITFHR